MRADDHPEKHICCWCDLPAVDYKLVRLPVIRKKDGVPTVIEAAEHAPACAEHMCIKTADDPVVVRAKRAAQAKKWKLRQERII